MYSAKSMLLASIIVFISASQSYCSEIKVFFDSQLTVTEISLEPYESTLGYIAIIGDSISDIAGWNGTLSWTDSLMVFPESYSSQCINVGQFPDYELAYSAALTSYSDRYLLATVTIFALGSGELCVAGSSPSEQPYYVNSISPGVYNYLIGCNTKSRTSIVYNRTILNSEVCAARDIEFTPPRDMLLSPPKEDCFQLSYDPRYDNLTLLDLGSVLIRSDFGLIGEVVDIDYRCYNASPGQSGYAICSINVIEPLWGYYKSHIPCAIRVNELDGCACWTKTPWPNRIALGDRLLLAANFNNNQVSVPRMFGVMIDNDRHNNFEHPSSGAFDFSNIYERLIEMKSRRSFVKIYEESDLIITTRLNEENKANDGRMSISIQDVIVDKRGINKNNIIIYYNGRYDPSQWLSLVVEPRTANGKLCTLYLKYDASNDAYYFVGGALGLTVLED